MSEKNASEQCHEVATMQLCRNRPRLLVQIMLHLLVVAMLVIGWMSVTISARRPGLCVLYGDGIADAGVAAPS